MNDELKEYEEKLHHIIRYHNSEVKISIKVSADYGILFYFCEMKIKEKSHVSQGRNLWKRYKEFVEILDNYKW